MTKALFFDIDGTLVSFKTHRVPDSTIEAIGRAKTAGCLIFISTGRPVQLIDNIGAVEHLIDGYVTTNGAHCFSGDTLLFERTIPREDVEKNSGSPHYSWDGMTSMSPTKTKKWRR